MSVVARAVDVERYVTAAFNVWLIDFTIDLLFSPSIKGLERRKVGLLCLVKRNYTSKPTHKQTNKHMDEYVYWTLSTASRAASSALDVHSLIVSRWAQDTTQVSALQSGSAVCRAASTSRRVSVSHCCASMCRAFWSSWSAGSRSGSIPSQCLDGPDSQWPLCSLWPRRLQESHSSCLQSAMRKRSMFGSASVCCSCSAAWSSSPSSTCSSDAGRVCLAKTWTRPR